MSKYLGPYSLRLYRKQVWNASVECLMCNRPVSDVSRFFTLGGY